MNTTNETTAILHVVREVLARHAGEPGALLPILHEVQDLHGCIPRQAVPVIASALNLSRAEVHGVISFYHHFREEPAAGRLIQICRAEACQSRGADALMAHAELALGCSAGQGGASADGRFTLEPTFCLGLCASSPALTMGDKLHARVTPARFDKLLADARSAA